MPAKLRRPRDLVERFIKRGRWPRLVQTVELDVTDNANDLTDVLRRERQCQPLADRIFPRPEALSHRFG